MDNTRKRKLDKLAVSLIETCALSWAYGDDDSKDSTQKLFEEVKKGYDATLCEQVLEFFKKRLESIKNAINANTDPGSSQTNLVECDELIEDE